MNQLNNPQHWVLIEDLNVQHRFVNDFNCEEFLYFLLAVTKDMDSVHMIHVNQSCYCHMQINNLIDHVPDSRGQQRPSFMGRIVVPTAILPWQDVPLADVELKETSK